MLSRPPGCTFSMDIHKCPWMSMDFHGKTMDFHGKSMDFHGFCFIHEKISWTSMEKPWTSMDLILSMEKYHGLPWKNHGLPWIWFYPWRNRMDFHGKSMDFHGFHLSMEKQNGLPWKKHGKMNFAKFWHRKSKEMRTHFQLHVCSGLFLPIKLWHWIFLTLNNIAMCTLGLGIGV